MMDKTTNPDVYSTTDFQSAIYLLCNNARFIRSMRIGEHKVEFTFADRQACFRVLTNIHYDDSVSLSRALSEIRKARDIIRTTV